MIHSLRNIFKFSGIMGQNTQTKVTLVNFPKKNLLLEQYGANLVQNYTTCINCSRYFQKYFSIMESNCQILVIIVNFPRKFSFAARGNLGKNHATLRSALSGFFLKLCSIMGYERPMQYWPTVPKNSFLVDRVKLNFGQNYATFCDDLLSNFF